jgi:hypothetical protein
LREALELLGDRLDKLPDRQGPHYTPVQRFQILRLKHTAQLTQDETARLFRVAVHTIARWEVQANPDSQTVGSTVTPMPRLNPHLHSVFLDGAWYEQGGELTWAGLGHLRTSEVGA